MSTEQHESLKLADQIHEGNGKWMQQAASELRRQHALIVQLAEALSDAADQTRHPDYDWPVWLSKAVSDANAAATQYLKGPKT